MKTPLRLPTSDSACAAPGSQTVPAALAAGLLALLLAGCAGFPLELPLPDAEPTTAESDPPATEPTPAAPEPEPVPTPQETAKPGQLYDLSGAGQRVTRIIIDTNEQRARFYNGDEQIGWTTVATGLNSHPTPTGRFEVLEKVADKRSNLYGRIYNSGGGLVRGNAKAGRDRVPPGGRFVGASMPHFMRLTYDGIGLHAGPIPHPGRPASHGCIRMPARVASALYSEVDIGTPVTIIGAGPDYGDYAARVRRERAAAEARRKALAAGGTPLEALDAEIAAEQASKAPPTPPAPARPARSTEPQAAEAQAADAPPTESPVTAPGDAEGLTAPPTENEETPVPYGRPPSPPPEIRSAARQPAMPGLV